MRLKILSNRAAIITLATQRIIKRINENTKQYFVLGLSTGATVLSICEELAEAVQKNTVSLKNVVIFYAGEYVGFSQADKDYYFDRLRHDFFSKVDLQAENIYTFNGKNDNLELECSNYEKKLAEFGGMDLFVGSLGTGGELAFNEPGSSLKSRTRIKTLTSETLKADARFFNNDISKVPKKVLTIGIETISEAKEVLIVVYGIQKAFAVKSCLENAISEMHPASILQLHPNTSFYIDKVAGRLLTNVALNES